MKNNPDRKPPGSFIWVALGALRIALVKFKPTLLALFLSLVITFALKFAIPTILTLSTHAVPEGKSAFEYYTLGFQYKAAGRTEEARECLTKAIAADNNGDIAKKARDFLKTRLPLYPVPEKAVSMNIKANGEKGFFTRDKAEEIWRQCIAQYPKFEWPYNNLGDLYVQEGKFKEAEKLLNSALNINPSYVNAWVHLSECKLKQDDKTAAQNCLDKALELDSSDLGAQLMILRMRLYTYFHGRRAVKAGVNSNCLTGETK